MSPVGLRRIREVPMPLPIEDYAVLGDTQTAALVGRDGSIDWLCLPRFDSGSVFAALLGTEEHGRWLLAPVAEIRETRRRYRGETMVLETEFDTDEGTVRLVDFMPPRGEAPNVVRVVEGVRGRVRMRMDLRAGARGGPPRGGGLGGKGRPGRVVAAALAGGPQPRRVRAGHDALWLR